MTKKGAAQGGPMMLRESHYRQVQSYDQTVRCRAENRHGCSLFNKPQN